MSALFNGHDKRAPRHLEGPACQVRLSLAPKRTRMQTRDASYAFSSTRLRAFFMASAVICKASSGGNCRSSFLNGSM